MAVSNEHEQLAKRNRMPLDKVVAWYKDNADEAKKLEERAVRSIHTAVLLVELAKQNSITVSEEELATAARAQAATHGLPDPDVFWNRLKENEERLRDFEYEQVNRKVLTWLREQVSIKHGKEISFAELTKGEQ